MQPIILLRKHAMAPSRWISAWNTDKKVTALTISCDNDEYGKGMYHVKENEYTNK